jgi:hypothetical protein
MPADVPKDNYIKKPSSLSTKLACGAVAGVIGTLIIYPLDIIKTTMQNSLIKQSFSTVYREITRNGLSGLYRGLAPNLVGIIPEKAIKLAVNDYAREYLAGPGMDPDRIPIYKGMIAGASAGFCQVIATNPMEIVRSCAISLF